MNTSNAKHNSSHDFLTALRTLMLVLVTTPLLSNQIMASTATKTITSPEKPATILELYTSQGCSSCPPAERWINTFTDNDTLWRELIPINFHVDYWDYLGWKDPFAKKTFSHRQRLYERLGYSRNVATPGFIVNGLGWSGWFYGNDIPIENIKQLSGKLTAELSEGRANISYVPKVDSGSLVVHISILGFGTETEIKRGENSGKTLKHDFVVVGYTQSRLILTGEEWNRDIALPETLAVPMEKQAIVVWISSRNDPSPLQAVADWL